MTKNVSLPFLGVHFVLKTEHYNCFIIESHIYFKTLFHLFAFHVSIPIHQCMNSSYDDVYIFFSSCIIDITSVFLFVCLFIIFLDLLLAILVIQYILAMKVWFVYYFSRSSPGNICYSMFSNNEDMVVIFQADSMFYLWQNFSASGRHNDSECLLWMFVCLRQYCLFLLLLLHMSFYLFIYFFKCFGEQNICFVF
jgi:hypothetical protein